MKKLLKFKLFVAVARLGYCFTMAVMILSFAHMMQAFHSLRERQAHADSRRNITLSSWKEGEIPLALFIIVPLSILNIILYPTQAYAFPAGAPVCSQDPGHCYGVIDWPGHVNGSLTYITVKALSSGGTAITHEMWLVDPNSQNTEQCYLVPNDSSTNGSCWVEGGYVINGPYSTGSPEGEYFFWADVRPGGEGYSVHYNSIPVQSGDYGASAEVYIFNAQHNVQHWSFCPNTYNEWCVLIHGNSSQMTGVSGNHNTNYMYPTEIQIGLEYIGGDGSANSPNVSFTGNEWQNSSNDLINYQKTYENPSNAGGGPPDYPVEACWLTPPNQSTTGGNFMTYLYPTGSGC